MSITSTRAVATSAGAGDARSQRPSGTISRFVPRLATALLSLLASLLVFDYVYSQGPAWARWASVGLSIAVLADLVIPGKSAWRSATTILLYLCLAGLFAATFQGPQLLGIPRLVKVAALYAVGLAPLPMILGAVGVGGAQGTLLVLNLLAALLVGESFIAWYRTDYSVKRAQRDIKLDGHPLLGWVNEKSKTIRSAFPDNPRQYFIEQGKAPKLDMRGFHEYAFPNYSIDVSEPRLADGVLTLRVAGPPGDHLNCNISQSRYRVLKDKTYQLSFRARASVPHSIRVTLDQAEPQWESLGLNEVVELDTRWRRVSIEFRANRDNQNSRLMFQLGGGDATIELADVTLTAEANYEVDKQGRYFVSHKVNSEGFRDVPHEKEKPPGVYRIVCLGDSFTYGMGVLDEDIFPRVVETLLNQDRPAGVDRVECMNLGVSGYGTMQERVALELYGKDFHPDLVILAMVNNDDLSNKDEIKIGVRAPTTLEYTSFIVRWFNEMFSPHYGNDFRNCLPEIMRIKRNCEDVGAELIVVVFRHEKNEKWQALADTMAEGLANTDIYYIDMGPKLLVSDEPMYGYKGIEHHPNEIAHRLTAEEIVALIRQKGLVKSKAASPPKS